MSVAFDDARWARIREASDRWWAGELDRPLICMTLYGRDPDRPVPPLDRDAVYDLDVPADDVVDAWDYGLAQQSFLGDGFPATWLNMGPVSSVAFFGAVPDARPGEGTVWFHPPRERELAELHFEHDPQNRWFKRAKELARAAGERWHGQVCVGTTGIASGLDVLSCFRPGEQLLLDLYDYPDEIKRCTDEICEAFFRQYDEIDSVLVQSNPGYTCWTPIYCSERYYAIQCDFCYMIGPDMFDEFVKPDLAACCRYLDRSLYHLDGPGQIPHLDSLLSIPELTAVQWVPGAGNPGAEGWPDLCRRVREAGKLLQIFGDLNTLDAVAAQLGSAEGICLIAAGHVSDREEIVKAMDKYGVVIP